MGEVGFLERGGSAILYTQPHESTEARMVGVTANVDGDEGVAERAWPKYVTRFSSVSRLVCHA